MEKVVYWEKQDPKTKMCALHCLNALLQGPFITADELCEISLMLDSEENRLLNTSGSHGYNGRVLGYGNVSESGDFNLPVLQQALLLRGISCSYLSLNQLSLSMFQRDDALGFICNIKAHWFSIRHLHHQWFILDSLREGPEAVEPGSLYDYIKQNLETKQGVVLVAVPFTSKLADPDPLSHPPVQPNQFYIKLSEIDGGNDFLSGGGSSFGGVVKGGCRAEAGQSATKVWPTTGGVRLDEVMTESSLEVEDEYSGQNAVKIAIKMSNNSRITRSFSPEASINNLFEWIEKNEDLKGTDFYYLLQTIPYRKFIKYSNGSIESLVGESGPLDVTGQSFSKLNFGSNDMFMLRLN